MRSTILFDLDGTLTDSGEGIARCVEAALRAEGLPPATPEQLRACVGPPLADSFARLGAPADRVEALIAAYRVRYREVGIFENAVYPAIPELLAALRERGCRLFVATSKPEPFAVQIVAHFGLDTYFEGVFGSNLDGSLADKHALLAHVQGAIAFDPSATALVGDRRYDVAAARGLGVLPVGVLWGYGSRDELIEAGAERLAEHPTAVLDALAA